jgi:pimeloyl-ACP methyl ester carboxylesterase
MFINVQGIKVYYEAVGSGTPVLLLHGWGVDSATMRPILTYLKESIGARAISLDFPGFGLSDHPAEAWNVSKYVTLVLGFLDQLGLVQVDIIAHSFGGRVAIKLAAGYPARVRKLVLVDSAGIRPPRSPAYYLRVYLAKLIRVLADVLPGTAGRLVMGKLLSNQGSNDYRSAGDMRPTFVRIVNEDLRHYLQVIKCPTLLVWGELDADTPLRDARLMENMIPNVCLKVLKGARHFCYLDDFSAFSQAITPFLEEKQ